MALALKQARAAAALSSRAERSMSLPKVRSSGRCFVR